MRIWKETEENQMLNLFKKKSNDQNINAVIQPVKGKIIDIAEVNDPAFSSENMGKGVAVIPESGEMIAPVSGMVAVAFPTGHAYGIQCDNGTEILIHIGIDTVELNGNGFKSYVRQGKRVEKGQKLVSVDLPYIKDKGFDPTVMIIVTNPNGKRVQKNLDGSHEIITFY